MIVHVIDHCDYTIFDTMTIDTVGTEPPSRFNPPTSEEILPASTQRLVDEPGLDILPCGHLRLEHEVKLFTSPAASEARTTRADSWPKSQSPQFTARWRWHSWGDAERFAHKGKPGLVIAGFLLLASLVEGSAPPR